MGYSWFSWWAITMVVFFIPYGLITAELGSAWPGEGGVYVWVREAFGPKWGSTVAWLYWINNATWIPSVYLIFAGTFSQMFLKTHSPWQEAGIAIVLTWITVAIGVVRLEVSKWVPNLGAVVKALIFLALGVLGLSALLRGRPPSNAFSIGSLAPKWNDTLAYLPALLYSTFGFELMSSAGGEMRDPKRDVPSVILWSGALIARALLVRHRRDPFRRAGGEALDRDGNLGRARGSRETVGTRRRHGRLSPRPRIPLRVRRQRRDLEPRRQPRGRGRGGRGRAAGGARSAAPAVPDAGPGLRRHGLRLDGLS